MDPEAFNCYGYARNNPILYNDPTGHFFGGVFGGILGGIFSGGNPIGIIAGIVRGSVTEAIVTGENVGQAFVNRAIQAATFVVTAFAGPIEVAWSIPD